MRHLRLALADFNAAAHDPALACGKHAADIVVAGVKEDDFQLPGLVLGDDPPGAAAPRGRPVMLDDKHFEGCDAAVRDIAERRAGTPVDQSDGKMPQQVDDVGTDAFLDCRRQLRSHTRQYRGGSEQAKNFSRASGVHGCVVRASGRSRLPETGLQDKIGMAVRKA